jgi:hypothetical protein
MWYLFNLLVMAVAALLGGLAAVLAPCAKRGVALRGPIVFWCALFCGGVAGSPLANRFWPEFVLTWPAALYAAYQLTLVSIVWAEGQASRQRARWLSRGMGYLFLAICLGYFFACRRLSMIHEWVFLFGFLPAWPVAVWAAKRLTRTNSVATQAPWALVGFSAYFWACGGFTLLRTAFETL